MVGEALDRAMKMQDNKIKPELREALIVLLQLERDFETAEIVLGDQVSDALWYCVAVAVILSS